MRLYYACMSIYAPEYWNELYAQERVYPPISKLLLKRMLEKARSDGKLSGTRALELGAGTGDFARKLATLGFDVTAVDFSYTAVAQAKELHPESASIEYAVADLETYKPDGVWDLVTMKLVLALIKDKEGLLERIRASLNDDGVFLLISPVLVEGETFNDHLKAISIEQTELEKLLSSIFGHVELFSEQYFGPNGIAAHYLIYK
jgi:2-polyprenyl-3-methyl-5-hydroxy-6-metoxy-1,4-benzoquinol methylase